MKIKTFNNTKGPGLWKFNNSLLDDAKYVRLIIELINKLKEDEQNYEDKRLWWEYFKYKICETSLQDGRIKAKELAWVSAGS
jgi:hypothetical protein